MNETIPSDFFDPDTTSGVIAPEIPSIDAIIGHWFACGEVYIVFAEGDGQQFFVIKETRERVYGRFLAAGQTWAGRDESAPLQGTARDQGRLRAYHEAGHTVVCIDEGIKVEYVTIIPQKGWNTESLLGYCQYDYRLPAALKEDTSVWPEKAAKADLAGPLADILYREQKKVDVSKDVEDAWRLDFSKAREYLAMKPEKEGKEVDLDQDIDRLLNALAARFLEPWCWVAVSRIAEKLCDEGAISGQVAKDIVEQAKAEHGDRA